MVQAITWTNVDKDIWRHMAFVGHNVELILIGCIFVNLFVMNYFDNVTGQE